MLFFFNSIFARDNLYVFTSEPIIVESADLSKEIVIQPIEKGYYAQNVYYSSKDELMPYLEEGIEIVDNTKNQYANQPNPQVQTWVQQEPAYVQPEIANIPIMPAQRNEEQVLIVAEQTNPLIQQSPVETKKMDVAKQSPSKSDSQKNSKNDGKTKKKLNEMDNGTRDFIVPFVYLVFLI